MKIDKTIDTLIKELGKLSFDLPVSHVYNPLEYARKSHDLYLHQFGKPPKEIVFIGMNPGPWGMAQTGVPFGEINAVREWMGIEADVGTPEDVHPKRPVDGFACPKSEVSGKRLWGWAKRRFKTPEHFFSKFFVVNYCPLLFIETGCRNRTPDKLPKAEKKRLFDVCDQALLKTVLYLQPEYVIGIGNFAAARAKSALKDTGIKIGRITHPSPANPKANKGWEQFIENELSEIGIKGF
ncbi:single-stranded DNA-binding protein [Desulfobacterales bacterium HSG16]|nr:single-stranded DNA-binding protein [Desulfobacterales bacterium HSG16]